MLLSADDVSVDSIQALPWWAQILIGVALVTGGAVLYQVDKKIDSGFLEILAFLLGCGGLYVTAMALF